MDHTLRPDIRSRSYPASVLESVIRCRMPFENRDAVLTQARQKFDLTIAEAADDVKDLFNCLKLCYSGYDDFFTDASCKQIQDKILKKLSHRIGRRISNEWLCEIIYRVLKPVIAESHFSLTAGGLYRQFSQPFVTYVTDALVKKADNGYLVIRGTGWLKTGALLTEKDMPKLLPTIAPEWMENADDQLYLIGSYSVKKVSSLWVAGKRVRLHRLLSDCAVHADISHIEDKGDYVIAYHPTYDLERSEAVYERFFNDGRLCAGKSAVILDLTGNTGGNDNFPEAFFRGLSGSDYRELTVEKLTDPQQLTNAERTIETIRPSDGKAKGTCDGKVYVLMNKASASSAESAIAMAKALPGAVQFGGASYGCGTYGDCYYYALPNSRIAVQFGYKKFHYPSFAEGKGFFPDYWIDHTEPLRVVEHYLLKWR